MSGIIDIAPASNLYAIEIEIHINNIELFGNISLFQSISTSINVLRVRLGSN